MEDLLFFLTGNIKKSGLTVNEFCSQVGISRQKFYRFVKEPFRFTNENVKRIKEVLLMNEADASFFDSRLGRGAPPASPADPSDYNRLIFDMFGRRPSEELAVNKDNIEYLNTSDSAARYSPESFARVIAGISLHGVSVNTAYSREHEYAFTIYNCTLEAENCASHDYVPSSSILTISCIVKRLEDILSSSRGVRIRVRHYLSEDKTELMSNHDIGNSKAMRFNLRLLTDVLPLLSYVEDYRIDTAGVTHRFWTEHSSMCLIEHRWTDISEVNSSHTDYYALVFSHDGECTACRLGSEEVSGIFRFLSLDTWNKVSMPSEQSAPANPNQTYYEMDRNYKSVLIHPDPCFDDIPKDMWLALYETVRSREDRGIFENIFRKLMDPYDQYAFLDFDALVHLTVTILDQRTQEGSRMGKIMICHPEGLRNFAKTGIITDLVSEDVDYTGKDLVQTPIRFPAPMVANLLRLIRESVIRRMSSPHGVPALTDSANYYIFKPQTPYPEISYVINREYGVFPIYNKGRHKNTLTNAYQNPAVGNLMYDFVVNRIIGRQGAELDSVILSDEHTIAFLDNLIAKAEKETS